MCVFFSYWLPRCITPELPKQKKTKLFKLIISVKFIECPASYFLRMKEAAKEINDPISDLEKFCNR